MVAFVRALLFLEAHSHCQLLLSHLCQQQIIRETGGQKNCSKMHICSVWLVYSFRRYRVDCRKIAIQIYIKVAHMSSLCIHSIGHCVCAPQVLCLPRNLDAKKAILHRGTSESAKTLTINCIKTIYEFLLPKRSKSNFFASEYIHSAILRFYISIHTIHFLIVLKLYFLWKEICV